jgi:uncharacterized lipoprotein YmbA
MTKSLRRPLRAPPFAARRPAALRIAAIAMGGACLIAGCSSAPPTTFHTLMPGGPLPASGPASPPGSAPLAFRIDPVHVPAQVDRPQWVLREPDGAVRVLEQQRWAAPLADEWRDALGAALSARLGALDLTHVGAAPAMPAYRLQLEVQRFDTVPGQGVRQETVWTLAAPGGAPALSCRSALSQSAAADYTALAAAHQRALDALADAIAQTLRMMQAGAALRCPG